MRDLLDRFSELFKAPNIASRAAVLVIVVAVAGVTFFVWTKVRVDKGWTVLSGASDQDTADTPAAGPPPYTAGVAMQMPLPTPSAPQAAPAIPAPAPPPGATALPPQATYPAMPPQMPPPVAGAAGPGMAPVPAPDPWALAGQAVAATRAMVTITQNQPRPHGNLGACTNCHNVLSSQGQPIPAISALSPLPHPYRGGVCANCHVFSSAPDMAGPANNVAWTGPTVDTMTGPSMRLVQPTAQNVPAGPAEGEWLGLEVTPLTANDTQRFGLAPDTTGVVVAEAEGAAVRAGVLKDDVITSVGGKPITGVAGFLAATQNGTLGSGLVELLRSGQYQQLWLGPNTPGWSPPTRQGNDATAANPAATAPVAAAQAPKKKRPVEGEWLGLEASPITPATARQFNLPANTQGVVVAEAEGDAARAGIKAGDVITSINGQLIAGLGDFAHVTQWGALPNALVGVIRDGQQRSLWLPTQPGTTNVHMQLPPPAQAAIPGSAYPVPQAAVPAQPGSAPRHF